MAKELIKNVIDAGVKAEAKELAGALKHAAEGINSLLTTLRHEMGVKHPHHAAMTLQALAEAAARHAVIAKMHDAQLEILVRMQEAANEEYTGEEKA